MNDAKLDQALAALSRLEARFEIEFGAVKKEIAGVKQELRAEIAGVKQELRAEIAGVKQELGGVKQELGGVKQELGGVKQELGAEIAEVKQKQDEMVAAFRAHWADMSNLYRTVREEQKQFEERMESKLTRVNQSILALRDSLERQDFRADEHGRRITRLELGDKPPY